MKGSVLLRKYSLAQKAWSVSLLLVMAILWPLSTLVAQTSTGQIVGVVRDTTGAVIPGVTVTAFKIGTAVSRNAITNEQGLYVILLLDPGHYRITAEPTGFKTYIREW